jgi:hypothetical protein
MKNNTILRALLVAMQLAGISVVNAQQREEKSVYIEIHQPASVRRAVHFNDRRPEYSPKDEIAKGLPGAQYAFLLKNERYKRLSPMQSVSFYIGEEGFSKEPFRVHIYKVDVNTQAPGAELLPGKEIILLKQDEVWHILRVKECNISVPKEGLFIALEYLELQPDERFHSDISPSAGFTWPRKFLRPALEQQGNGTWQYTKEHNWEKLPLNSDSIRRYSAAIEVEFDSNK